MWRVAFVALLLAGCIDPDPNPQAEPLEPTPTPTSSRAPTLDLRPSDGALALQFEDIQVTAECGGTALVAGIDYATTCREPTVAVHPDGTWLFSTANGEVLARSSDALNWTRLDPPPRPATTVVEVADAHITFDPHGRLWWSALSTNTLNVVYARSPDLGDTWDLVGGIGYAPVDAAPAVADRQWFAFAPDGRILMLCNCPALTAPMLAWSDDDGASWTITNEPDLASRSAPPGPPLFLEDGTLLVPYITGGTIGTARGDERQVAVGVQRDDGFDIIPLNGPDDPLICCAWPHLTVDHEGQVWAAWSGDEGPVVAVSADGRTWSPPTPVEAPSGIASPHPGIAPYMDGVVLSWFNEERPGHMATVIGRDAGVAHFEVGKAPFAASDYNDVRVGPDGTVVVPWTMDGGWVSVGRLAPDEPGAAR